MKTTSFVIAGMASILLGVTVFACAAPGPADEEENVGEARQGLCRTSPCTDPVDPTTRPTVVKPPPPPPPPGQPFDCTGDAGYDSNTEQEMFWGIDCRGAAAQAAGACVCVREEFCRPGAVCNGFSVISSYVCPTLFPYQRCGPFGGCTCNAYPN